MLGEGVKRQSKQGNASEGSPKDFDSFSPFSSHPGESGSSQVGREEEFGLNPKKGGGRSSRKLEVVVPYWELKSTSQKPNYRPSYRTPQFSASVSRASASGLGLGEASGSALAGGGQSPGALAKSGNFGAALSLETRLDDLLRSGVSGICSFVPWQVLECDISHRFLRFLQAVSEREMDLTLMISPEPGVSLPGAGLPRDLLRVLTGSSESDSYGGHSAVPPAFDAVARSVDQRKYGVFLPPRAFPLPSLQSVEFQKRFPVFLSRLDTLLTDASKASKGKWLARVQISMGGSFYRYMRQVRLGSKQPFEGVSGDWSSAAQLVYHGKLERWVQEGEMGAGGAVAAQRWKGKASEPWMRRKFAADQEQSFRSRMTQALNKKWSSLGLVQLDLWVPEADPWVATSWMQQSLHGTASDSSRLSRLIESLVLRQASSPDSAQKFHSDGKGPEDYPLVVYFGGLGPFGCLSDVQKQQLLLKTLILTGARGGRLWIEDQIWLELSRGFRHRLETICSLMNESSLQMRPKAMMWGAHLWSEVDGAFDLLTERLNGATRLVDQVRTAVQDPWAPLVWVDSHCILESESVASLAAWGRSGRVLVVPTGVAMTEVARRDLDRELEGCPSMELTLGEGPGGKCRILNLGSGKWIWWDSKAGAEVPSAAFVDAILSLSEIDSYCQTSDARMKVIAAERDDEGLALFVFNESSRPVVGDLLFPVEVGVTDLGSSMAGGPPAPGPTKEARDSSRADVGAPDTGGGAAPKEFVRTEGDSAENMEAAPTRRLSLEIPPYGVVPLAVSGLSHLQIQEKRFAQMHAEVTRRMAVESAINELPGFVESARGGSLDPANAKDFPWS
jgi:hypothetical protein